MERKKEKRLSRRMLNKGTQAMENASVIEWKRTSMFFQSLGVGGGGGILYSS